MHQNKSEDTEESQWVADLDPYQNLSSWHSEQWFYNLTEYIPGVSIHMLVDPGNMANVPSNNKKSFFECGCIFEAF